MTGSREEGRPLQIVKLNMEERRVDVNEDALSHLETRLRGIGAQNVAIVSVMGAFRTGKSFLLDLFLRFLRYDSGHEDKVPVPPRGSGEPFPLPQWMTAAGNVVDGATHDSCSGFRFKGGMDACTEGIWVWSEPFLRSIKGKPVALLLMDTQGAWDSNMTKEQSATVFGLTAVLSSKQIYNIHMQIQEDKVENLAYFMRFAQAAIRNSNELDNQAAVERPFQSLDFVVRDWRHFREGWTVDQCREQMAEHLSRHMNPNKVVENSTAQALQSMFQRISCFCFPHPGLAIEKETWSGDIKDIDRDFIRFIDVYARQVFSEDLDTKTILGSELSTMTLPMVVKHFVAAFHDAAPVAMSFTQAMTNATVLLAKEQAMKSYTQKMDMAAHSSPRGMDPKQLGDLNSRVSAEIQKEFERVTIFGSDSTRKETWDSIRDSLQTVFKRYEEDNDRRLEKALVSFANLALLALILFILDRLSDWTCDWWSQTCADVSRLMLTCYLGIAAWIGFNTYLLMNDRGRLATAVAGGELWKEMMRLCGVYLDYLKGSPLSAVVDKLGLDKNKKD